MNLKTPFVENLCLFCLFGLVLHFCLHFHVFKTVQLYSMFKPNVTDDNSGQG